MDYGAESVKTIDIDRVFLDLSNPRHTPFDDQDGAIDYLCRKEHVLPLARDIAINGLNPLELFALLADGDNAYISAEGNRRLCALKLLKDPDLAPADFRKGFEASASEWSPVQQLLAVVFKDRNEVKLWLNRIHAGFADGRGRRQWNAEQKTRNSGYSKNDLAQIILDLGEERRFIAPAERQGRLSTVQRYLGNPLMRDAFGLDISDFPSIETDLPEYDFDIALKRFIGDVAQKSITTRDNASKIADYSHELRNSEGMSGDRVPKYVIAVSGDPTSIKSKSKLKTPKKPTRIASSEELQAVLGDIQNYKLEKLYYSLCALSLPKHTPLLSVGAWSFIETLTALSGRKSNVDFYAYMSAQKLQALGVGDNKDTKSMREAVKRVSEYGNSTKHDPTSAAFNGEQLSNDFETMEKMLIALAKQLEGEH